MIADKHEAHKSSVSALASLGPHLYSGATKSLKIWDTFTMQSISELNDFGSVKAIVISQYRKLLIAAADK